MSDQLELWNEPKVRWRDPETSRAAAMSVLPMVGSQENRVLERFGIYGPMTDEVLCLRSPQWHGPTIISCRSRLAKRGLLVRDGVEVNSRGRNMIRWRLP